MAQPSLADPCATTSQRVFLTGTVVRGTFVLRVCVLSFRTHADRMEMFLEDLRGALAAC